MEQVIKFLTENKLEFISLEHDAVHTAKETVNQLDKYGYETIRNLFLTNRNGTKFYLLSTPAMKEFNLNAFCKEIGIERLSFGTSEQLMDVLKVESGSVGAFNLINASSADLTYLIDRDILKFEHVTFHPNRNDYTFALTKKCFREYLKYLKVKNKIVTI